MHRLARVLLAAAALTVSGCGRCSAPPPGPVETPERQFVFEGMQIEERRGERVLWTGTGERADGDMTSAWVDNVELEYAAVPERAGNVMVVSPRALLEFDAGLATFEEVVIRDDAGGTLEAGRARYEEEHSHILASGPLQFSAGGMTAHAESGVVLLDQGRVDIEGPVRGVYLRPAE